MQFTQKKFSSFRVTCVSGMGIKFTSYCPVSRMQRARYLAYAFRRGNVRSSLRTSFSVLHIRVGVAYTFHRRNVRLLCKPKACKIQQPNMTAHSCRAHITASRWLRLDVEIFIFQRDQSAIPPSKPVLPTASNLHSTYVKWAMSTHLAFDITNMHIAIQERSSCRKCLLLTPTRRIIGGKGASYIPCQADSVTTW